MVLTGFIRGLKRTTGFLFKFEILLITIPLLALLLHISLGKYQIPPLSIFSIFIEKFSGRSSTPPTYDTVIFNIRLPRALLAALFGASTGIAGASLQSTLRNPLVSPYVLGISSGAAFGAALSIALGVGRFGHGLLIEAFSFSFALLAIFMTLSISWVRGELSPTSLVLAGIIVSALFTGLLSLVQIVVEPEKTQAIVSWMVGRLNAATWNDVSLSAPLAVVGILGLILLRWRIFILSIGDEEARSLGVNVRRDRMIVIIFASMATASVVAVAGIIGWTCLISPHLTRLIVGSDPRKLLLASQSLGATFLLVTDSIAKSVWTFEIPVGVIATFVGAPLFLYLMRRSMYTWGG